MTANEYFAMGGTFYSIRFYNNKGLAFEVTTIHKDEIPAQIEMWAWNKDLTAKVFQWDKDHPARQIG